MSINKYYYRKSIGNNYGLNEGESIRNRKNVYGIFWIDRTDRVYLRIYLYIFSRKLRMVFECS